MSAVFSCKKYIRVVLAFCTVLFVAVSCVYAHVLTKATCIDVQGDFYFLVSNSTHIEASTQENIQDGGAGYLLIVNGREYVAYCVYFTQSEGERIQEGIGEETKLISLQPKKLYFKTKKEKRKAQEIENAFSCLQDCMEVLNQEIARLDKGATQQSSKRVLNVLTKQFIFLRDKYSKLFPAYSTLCDYADNFLTSVLSNVIYTRDLRYLLCVLSDGCVALSEKFEL